LKSILGSALNAFIKHLNQYTLADVIIKGDEAKAADILGLSSYSEDAHNIPVERII
jgi:ABC-type maltose transport system permease subunit